MKRLVIIALTCLLLVCAGGTIGAYMFIQAGSGTGELPVYAGAQNVQRGEPAQFVVSSVPVASSSMRGVTFSSAQSGSVLRLETTASAQSVYDFYENWFLSHGWSGTSSSSPTAGSFIKYGSLDLSRIQFLRFSDPFIPHFMVPRHYFTADVKVKHTNGLTSVSIFIVDMVR